MRSEAYLTPQPDSQDGRFGLWLDIGADDLHKNQLAVEAGWPDHLVEELQATDMLYGGHTPEYVRQFDAWVRGEGEVPPPTLER